MRRPFYRKSRKRAGKNPSTVRRNLLEEKAKRIETAKAGHLAGFGFINIQNYILYYRVILYVLFFFHTQLFPYNRKHGKEASCSANDLRNHFCIEYTTDAQMRPGQQNRQWYDQDNFPEQGEEDRIFRFIEPSKGILPDKLKSHHKERAKINADAGKTDRNKLWVIGEDTDYRFREENKNSPYDRIVNKRCNQHELNTSLNPVIFCGTVIIPQYGLSTLCDTVDRLIADFSKRIDDRHGPDIKDAQSSTIGSDDDIDHRLRDAVCRLE